MPDAPHEFVQFLVDHTPMIVKCGPGIDLYFEEDGEAEEAMGLLAQAIDSIKPRDDDEGGVETHDPRDVAMLGGDPSL